MNISKIQLGGIRSGLDASEARTDRPAPTGSTSAASADRVELSGAGAGAPTPALPPEISALRPDLDTPELSAERRAELEARIESGYYSRPDVLEQVAQRVLDEVTGVPPEKSWAQKAAEQTPPFPDDAA
jgi:hypothetical protein